MEKTKITKDIAIYGAGGFGREVACMIKEINEIQPQWNLIGFFDDGKPSGYSVSHFGTVLGNREDLNNWPKELSIVICLGSPASIKSILDAITNQNIKFPNLISPSFKIGDIETFKIGEGNIIKGNCSVTTGVMIGNFNILNGFINIGHDAQIGNFNVLMPGVRVSGDVSIGNNNLIGADSFIKQAIKIGNNITLSPLSALLTKPKDGNIYIGNPARKFTF